MHVLEIGLVMLQGSRQAHVDAIGRASERMGFEVNIREIRTPDDLLESTLQALILPGGESTTMRKVGGQGGTGVLEQIYRELREKPNFPVLATCAGAILLADPQDGGPSIIKATVDRNAWGRQIDSFLGRVSVNDQDEHVECAFIRAPRFTSAREECTIAKVGDEPVGVRENNLIALTFHPELSTSTIFHEMLLEAAASNGNRVKA